MNLSISMRNLSLNLNFSVPKPRKREKSIVVLLVESKQEKKKGGGGKEWALNNCVSVTYYSHYSLYSQLHITPINALYSHIMRIWHLSTGTFFFFF